MAGKVFLTGDTHGHYDTLKLSLFAEKREDLDKDDYVIILGDFGVLWSEDEYDDNTEYLLKMYKKLPFTVLWLDGNHENFNLLEKFKTRDMFGGKVRRITKDIYHLERGYIFEIYGKKFFVCGGATSIDKAYRTEYTSWWPQENISNEDFERSIENLAKHNNSVDFVLTHCAPTRYAKEVLEHLQFKYMFDINEAKLEDLLMLPIKFDKWYFGHYHDDYDSAKFACLYQNVIQII